MVVFKDFVFWCLQASFGLNRPILWQGKGRQKKDRCVFPHSVPRFPRYSIFRTSFRMTGPVACKKGPENWDGTWKRPQKKRTKSPWNQFLGFQPLVFLECTSIPKVFWHIYFLRGFVFFSWQGFLTWPGSLFSGSISASEELHAVEGSNILKGDEEIKEEIDDAFRMVSVRMVSRGTCDPNSPAFFF